MSTQGAGTPGFSRLLEREGEASTQAAHVKHCTWGECPQVQPAPASPPKACPICGNLESAMMGVLKKEAADAQQYATKQGTAHRALEAEVQPLREEADTSRKRLALLASLAEDTKAPARLRMRAIRAMLAGWGLALIGCASPVPMPAPVALTVLADEWSPEELEAMADAAAFWQERAPGALTLEVGTLPPSVKRQDFAGDALGRGRLGRVGVDVDTPHEAFFSVVRHEMGHALGLLHSSEGVMAEHLPNDLSAETWTAGDQVECERVGVCP